jgi:hypothetical protein
MVKERPADYTVAAREVIESAGRFYMPEDVEADARHRRETALGYAPFETGERLQNIRMNGMHVSAERVL